jgi:hypothetical protein
VRVARRRRPENPAEWDEVEMSWSLHNPRDIKSARAYGEAILEACRIGEEMSVLADP